MLAALGAGGHTGPESDAASARLLASQLSPDTVGGSVAAEPDCQGVILERQGGAKIGGTAA